MRKLMCLTLFFCIAAVPFTYCADDTKKSPMPTPPHKKWTDKAAFPTHIDEKDVVQYLQDISVTIQAKSSSGSGVFKVTKDGRVYVWTCGHLVEHLRTERKNSDGKTVVEFADAKIIKVLNDDGIAEVAEMSFRAEVIRYSHAENGHDLALLRLRTKSYRPPSSVVFYLEENLLPVGTKMLHCGSLLGQIGSNSMTNGIISQRGRVLFNDKVFDQTNSATFPGSSGGIMCLEKDGRYVGMLVRGAGETFGLYVPIRRMREWAKKTGVEFTLDDKLPIPSDEELRKFPVDDSLYVPKNSDAAASKKGVMHPAD